MPLPIVPFLFCSFALFHQSSLDSPNFFVFVTLSSNGHEANVNLVTDQSNNYGVASSSSSSVDVHLPSLFLPLFGQSFKMRFLYNISARSLPDGSAPPLDSQNVQLSLFTAKMNLKKQQQKSNGSIEYSLIGGAGGKGETRKLLKWPKRDGKVSDQSPLRVCVFGDYRADVMYTRELNLSNYIVSSDCHLNLFIGKITWEQRNCPNCSAILPNSSPFREDVGLSFSPFSMLHDHDQANQTSIFASVPSVFGAIGHNLNETTFFDCTEFDGVAFIQTTVEVSTVARLGGGNRQTEQFKYVERYFRETMLNELECKLQELHRRPLRPWVIVYLTHPSLINEKRTDVLSLKDNDRFFEILNRYKIDLLLSCGVEGMAKSLAERHRNNPNEQLPPYLNTTMATCLSANFEVIYGHSTHFWFGRDISTQEHFEGSDLLRECQYLVLEVKNSELNYWYKSGVNIAMKNGKIQKSTQNAGVCVLNEIQSIRDKNTTKIMN